MNSLKIANLVTICGLLIGSCGTAENQKGGASQKENFHIYLLMGQSNMAGRGLVEPIDTIAHTRVLMLDKDNSWVPAKNPIHFDKPIAGTGLGLTFGKLMANENDDITIGLVPCAKGGSSINQWFPDSMHQATNTYPYNEMIAKAKKAMADGTLKGILWHQGEADTKSMSDITGYHNKLNSMLNLLTSDLRLQSVPMVMGEIGYFFAQSRPLVAEMNLLFKQIANQTECLALVSASDLSHKGDSVHFDSKSYRKLGERYASKMLELQSECTVILIAKK